MAGQPGATEIMCPRLWPSGQPSAPSLQPRGPVQGQVSFALLRFLLYGCDIDQRSSKDCPGTSGIGRRRKSRKHVCVGGTGVAMPKSCSLSLLSA